MVRSTDVNDDSGAFKLRPLRKTAKLNCIKFGIRESIFFRLLLCKEGKKTFEPDFCPYPDYKNESATKKTCESKGKLAHIYFGYEQPEKVHAEIARCIVIFSKNDQNADELAQRLKATVTHLGIKGEKIYFYVVPFHYEKTPVIQLNRHKLKKEIRNQYAGSQLKIEKHIQMKEENDFMTLNIDRDPKANKFLITQIIENKESK